MKKLTLIMTIIACASTLAQTTPEHALRAKGMEAHLYNFKLQEGHLPPLESGKILVREKNITLTLNPSTIYCVTSPCPQEATRTIELPIVSKMDSCGSKVTVAEIDRRPVDGLFQQITVQDHSERRCKDLRKAITEITYEVSGVDRRNGKAFSFRHLLLGGKFHSESYTGNTIVTLIEDDRLKASGVSAVLTYSPFEFYGSQNELAIVIAELNGDTSTYAFRDVKVSVDSCNTTIYQSGTRGYQILVKDFSTMTCEILVPNLIEVEVNVLNETRSFYSKDVGFERELKVQPFSIR